MIFFLKIIIHFINVETDPRLRYYGAGKQLPNMLGKVPFVSPFHYVHIFGECLWQAMKWLR